MYEFTDRIRYSEVDADCRLNLHTLLDYFQDCSLFHSQEVGLGVEYLSEQHLAWVLSSWQICISEMPVLGERVQVQTWAYDMRAFYGYRNFCMNREDGQRLAYANSIWVLMDMEKQRPVKVPEVFGATYGLDEQLPMECCKRKISVPQQLVSQPSFVVPAYFIDSNRHMNNAKYVLAAQEYLPEDFKVKELRVDYRKAAKAGDLISPAVAVDKDRCTVALADDQGKPYSVVEFLGEETQ